MHSRKNSRTHTLRLAIALVLASGLSGQVFAGDVITCGAFPCNALADDITNDTVDSADIKDGTITGGTGVGADIGVNTITADNIATDAVDTAEIATDAVGQAEIATDAVGSDELAVLTDLQVVDGGTDLAVDSSGFDLEVDDLIVMDADDGTDASNMTMTPTALDASVTTGSGAGDHSDLKMTATTADLTVTDTSGAPYTNGVEVTTTSTTITGGTGTATILLNDDLDFDASGFVTIDAASGVASLTAANGAASVTATGGDATLESTDAAAIVLGNTAASVTATTGPADLTALAGAASVTATGGDATLESTDQAAIVLGQTAASVTANTGDVTVEATTGDVFIDANGAAGDVDITAHGTGTASLNHANGSSFDAFANGDASMRSGTGDGRVDVTDTSASVTVDNGVRTHGLEIDVVPGNTTLSGGTASTTLTLNDSGAHLDNRLDMGLNQINNLADGTSKYDAVNKRQLDDVEDMAKEGIAAVAAMAAIPGPIPGKRYSVGIGAGFYKSESALAIGFNAQVTDNIMLTASAGATSNETAGAAGASFSW